MLLALVRKLKKISCEVARHLKFIMHLQKAIEPIMQQPINNNPTVSGSMSMPLTPAAATSTTTTPLGLGLGPSSNKMSRALYAHKLRTHTNKLKQQTNKIMSNLKGINQGVFFLMRSTFFMTCMHQKNQLIFLSVSVLHLLTKHCKFFVYLANFQSFFNYVPSKNKN